MKFVDVCEGSIFALFREQMLGGILNLPAVLAADLVMHLLSDVSWGIRFPGRDRGLGARGDGS